MTAESALRFLDFQASCCRTRDEHEALCLLLPALLRVLDLKRMDYFEAEAFKFEFKGALTNQAEKTAAR